MRGELFENLVVNDFLKHRTIQGLEAHLYFYRDSHLNEVDLIQTSGNNCNAIKSSQTYRPGFRKSLLFFENMFSNRINKKMSDYTGDMQTTFKGYSIVNFTKCLSQEA